MLESAYILRAIFEKIWQKLLVLGWHYRIQIEYKKILGEQSEFG
jgi:hypothetical protein